MMVGFGRQMAAAAINGSDLPDIRGLLFADVSRDKVEVSKHCTSITLTPEGSTTCWADVRMVPAARHERIATSVSPSRSRHKSFGCYEMCACTV